MRTVNKASMRPVGHATSATGPGVPIEYTGEEEKKIVRTHEWGIYKARARAVRAAVRTTRRV